MAGKSLVEQIQKLVTLNICDQDVAERFLQRLHEGKLTRDENPQTHFCIYFAAINPKNQEVFVGHHKKSGLWLFNGGHIDETETLERALEREIEEEWGMKMSAQEIGNPSLLTITPIIHNPTKQSCRDHYDIWYFVAVDRDNFHPDQEKLTKEFYETRWLNLDEARRRVKDASTPYALEVIEKRLFKN